MGRIRETVCGYPMEDLVQFAIACRNAGITEDQLRDFHDFEELAIKEIYRRIREEFAQAVEEQVLYGGG